MWVIFPDMKWNLSTTTVYRHLQWEHVIGCELLIMRSQILWKFSVGRCRWYLHSLNTKQQIGCIHRYITVTLWISSFVSTWLLKSLLLQYTDSFVRLIHPVPEWGYQEIKCKKLCLLYAFVSLLLCRLHTKVSVRLSWGRTPVRPQ